MSCGSEQPGVWSAVSKHFVTYIFSCHRQTESPWSWETLIFKIVFGGGGLTFNFSLAGQSGSFKYASHLLVSPL